LINAQAWYLLSLLVDSPAKKQAYLQKAAELDPTHEKAVQQLSQLTNAPLELASTPDTTSSDFDTNQVEPAFAEPLPEWLTDMQPSAEAPAVPVDDEQEATLSSDEEIPDWLKDTFGDHSIESEQPTLVSEPEKIMQEAVETSPREEVDVDTDIFEEDTEEEEIKESDLAAPISGISSQTSLASKGASAANMNRLLYILIAGAVVTFILLLYVIFTAL